MKRRMEQLLNGKFEYEVQSPDFSVKTIRETLKEAEFYTGSFDVTSPGERKMRGFMYSSNTRVLFDPQQFSGHAVHIVYQVDTEGLSAGDTVDGVFTLCTDLGEYRIPYQFQIQEKEEQARPRAALPAELMDLAKEDMDQARKVYMDASYANYLKNQDRSHYLLQQSLLRSGDVAALGSSGKAEAKYLTEDRQAKAARALEEYLIGAAGKEPVELSLEETHIELDAPERAIALEAELKRSTWGYLEISASSDARFLRLERRKFTTDDFVGDTFRLEYIIDTNFLHAGRNYGRITIRSCYQTIYLEVQVNNTVLLPEDQREQRVQKIMRSKMLGLYEDLRLKRIEMQAWIDRSMSVLGSYRRSGGEDLFAELFLAQLYFADGKRVKSSRILQDMGQNLSRFQTEEQYGYYLYMTTFFEKDASYVDQVEARIVEMFRRKSDSWILQWILLYLQERYLKSEDERLEAIRTQVDRGCASPIMYLEAASIFRRNPYLLRRLDGFEKKVLLYMAKSRILTDELAAHVGNLAMQGAEFEPKLYHILECCYEVSSGKDCLKAICYLLIAAGKKDPVYFRWYALAVQADLRITGLYEYYMETMDTAGIEKMPQIIRMYFSYDNSLNYHKKAAIYRDISDNRESVPQVYRQSRPQIELFITEQLSLGRIDENLAVLYERFLTRRMLTRSLADKLAGILFAFEVTCKNPHMKSVVVIHDRLRAEQEVPLRDGRARVEIFGEDARILLVGEDGHRYASPSLYRARRCLDAPLLITYCREIVPEHPVLTLYFTGKNEPVMPLTVPYYKKAEEMDRLTDSFRRTCRKKLMDYFLENPRGEQLYAYLKRIDLREFAKVDKNAILELCAREGMYEEAFSLLESFGSEGLDPQCLVRIASQLVLSREYDEDPQLLACAHQCFACGKYDDNILTYLLMYYDGPIEEMKRLWNTGKMNELDTLVLEEKILSLMLFTGTGSSGSELIFASYEEKLGRRKICRAYVILKSYEYLVRNLPVSDIVFTYLERLYKSEEDMEEVELLALLQYYSTLETLSEQRTQIARKILEDFAGRGIRFAFFQRLPKNLTAPCQIRDRVFLEYVADPAHTVVLKYRRCGSDAFTEEVMNNTFEGIFVREFILFEGEKVECFTEEYDGDELVKTSGVRSLVPGDIEEGDTSRYACLSRMAKLSGEGKKEEVSSELAGYVQLDVLTEKLFTLV